MASVLLPLAEGFEEVEAVGLIDTMRRGGIEVRIAYIDDRLSHGKVVIGANGIGIKADTVLKNVISDDFDMMVLPGGWGGTHALAEHARVITLVQEFKEKKIIGAMCAAPYVLKKAGVLGNDYTCYPGAKDEIDHPGYRDDLKVVTDGNVMTSQGPGTAVCFGLAIVERLVGKASMQDVKDRMLLDYCQPMRDKIKEMQNRIDQDPKLKEAVTRIKPKKTLQGIVGIILFFFLPELITFIWQDELISWAHEHGITEPLSMQRWLYGKLEEMFISGVNGLNITLGVLLLLWVWRSK